MNPIGMNMSKLTEEKIEKKEFVSNKIEDKHLKGYIFDSLVYRYKLAREKQADYEVRLARDAGKLYEDNNLREAAKRDELRFIEILEEVIGERD